MVITPTEPSVVDLTDFKAFKDDIAKYPLVDATQAQKFASKAAQIAFQLSELKAGIYHHAEITEAEAKRLLAQGKMVSTGKNADEREANARNSQEYIDKIAEASKSRAAQYHLQECYEMVQALHYFYSNVYKGESKVGTMT